MQPTISPAMPSAVDVFVAGRLARSIPVLLARVAVRPDVAVEAIVVRAFGRRLHTNKSIAVVAFITRASSAVLRAARGADTLSNGVVVARLTFRTIGSIAVVAFVARASSGVLNAAGGAGAFSDSVLVAFLAGNAADSVLAVRAGSTLGAIEPIASISRIAFAGDVVSRGPG